MTNGTQPDALGGAAAGAANGAAAVAAAAGEPTMSMILDAINALTSKVNVLISDMHAGFVEQATHIQSLENERDSLRLSGVSPERGEKARSSGEKQIGPGVLSLPGQVQAVASTVIACQPAFDQDIDGQISLNKDLPSVLVLPERGGAKAFDAMVTPGMEIVDPLSLAKNPGSKIMQKVESSSQIVKSLFYGFSHSLCKVLRFLEISSQIVQGVWKNSDNKENEGFSDFFSLTRNVKMLISKKIVYYFASWILHDFKKRKKVKIRYFISRYNNLTLLKIDCVISMIKYGLAIYRFIFC